MLSAKDALGRPRGTWRGGFDRRGEERAPAGDAEGKGQFAQKGETYNPFAALQEFDQANAHKAAQDNT